MPASQKSFDVDLSLTGQLGNRLLGEFDTLRELDPIHWSDASKCWLITRHADVDDALQGKFPLSLKRVERFIFEPLPAHEKAQLPMLQRFIPHWPVELDPPEHTRLRKLLVKAFSKKVVEGQRPFVVERVAMLIEKLRSNPQVEFNEEIARQLPGAVILKLFGLSQDLLERLKEWANAFQEGIGVPYADIEKKKRAERALAEMTALFEREIEKRRRAPGGDDLISSLLAATEGGDSLSEDEMLGALQLILVAGHDTTSATLTLGMAALADHPELWEHMHRHPEKILDSSMELMRYISMSTAQARVAAEDFDWHGKKIKKGELLFLIFGAANRDPRVFPDPERIIPERNFERSMVFAPGLHHCIGHILAKMQVTEFFSALTKDFSGAKVLDLELAFMSQIAFRGLFHLNVRVTPRVN